jgi:uncharacterized protein (TIGR01777 family)
VRIGVTGSTGLIGAAVVAALRGRGDEVIRFVRPSSAPVDGSVVRWDPVAGTFDDDDLAAVGGLDGVIHLAGAGIADRRWSSSYRSLILTSRTTSTATIASLATRLPDGLPTLESGSAIGSYGSRGDEVLDEHSSNGADYLASVCAAWEAAAASAESAGTHVSHARTGIVLSPQGGALKKLLPLFRAGIGGQLGNGRQWMSPISLDDEVRALLFLLDGRHQGAFNLVAPEPCTNRHFTKALGSATHRPSFAAVPAVAMKVVLGAECASETVLASQRVVPTALLNAGFTFTGPTIETALTTVL